MSKKSVLLHETIMYSVNRTTGMIVTHHLPWEKGNPQLDHYVEKGFTYERPPEKVVTAADMVATEIAERNISNTKGKYRRKVKA